MIIEFEDQLEPNKQEISVDKTSKTNNKFLFFFAILTLAFILVTNISEIENQVLDLKTYKEEACFEDFQITEFYRLKQKSMQLVFQDDELDEIVKEWVLEKNFSSVMAGLSKYFVPWIVLFVFSSCGFYYYCCIGLKGNCDKCMKYYPPTWCQKKEPDQKFIKIEESQIRALAIFSALLVIYPAYLGIILHNDIKYGVEAYQCGAFKFQYDVIYQQDSYLGLIGVQEIMQNISNQFAQFQNQTRILFQQNASKAILALNQASLDANYNMSRGQSDTIVPILDDNQKETYLSANFVDYILSDQNDTNYDNYSLNYKQLDSEHKQYLIVNPQKQLMANYYNQMIQIFQNLEGLAYSISQEQQFNNTNIDSGIEYLNLMLNKSLNSKFMRSNPVQGLEKFLYIFDWMLYISFLASVLIGGLVILTIVPIFNNNCTRLRFVLYASWILYIPFILFLVIIAGILHPLSAFSTSSCKVVKEAQEVGYFNKNQNYFGDDSQNTISFCLNSVIEQENYIQAMNLTEALGPLQPMFLEIKKFIQQNNNLQKQKKTFTDSLNNNLAAFQNTKEGAVFDIKPDDYSTYSAAFTKFNSFKSNTGCVELATQTCTDGKLPMKSSSDTDTTKYNQNCWHPAYLATTTPSCADQSALPETTTLQAQYSKQSSLWSNALTKEQNFITLNQHTLEQFTEYALNISQFYSNSNEFFHNMNLLTNPINCSVVQNSFNFYVDVMYYIFTPNISEMSIILRYIVASVISGALIHFNLSIQASKLNENKIHSGDHQSLEQQTTPDENSDLQKDIKDHFWDIIKCFGQIFCTILNLLSCGQRG